MKTTNLTEKEKERVSYLSHIPNCYKTDQEFKEHCAFSKKLGLPQPNRNSKVRPLHEIGRYDK
nr:MAG TPA: hypothetical protein [Caudoviricetes sp.]